jgi:hypothetical protein
VLPVRISVCMSRGDLERYFYETAVWPSLPNASADETPLTGTHPRIIGLPVRDVDLLIRIDPPAAAAGAALRHQLVSIRKLEIRGRQTSENPVMMRTAPDGQRLTEAFPDEIKLGDARG